MIRNILLAIVSKTSPLSLAKPVSYQDIWGRPYDAIHTNEAGIVYLMRRYGRLDQIFLLVSPEVQKEKVADGSGRTHIEFLHDRLEAVYPGIWRNVEPCPYGTKRETDATVQAAEGAEAADAVLDDIAQIANRVSRYAAKVPGDELVVHADMTGGFRYTSMMMLAIMQMLKYRRIGLGEVLYADNAKRSIYKATSIQRMFDLINGADEFVNFGSVQSLRGYFDAEVVASDESLRRLLEGMQRFSDAVKICSTASIESEVRQLGERLIDFACSPHAQLQARLLGQLIDTIRTEYGPLLQPGVSRLDIIRWCLAKGFWQQVMTLCTEWIPYYLVDTHIAYTDDAKVQEVCRRRGRKMQRDWQQDFIINYTYSKVVTSDIRVVHMEALRRNLREAAEKAEKGVWEPLPQLEGQRTVYTRITENLNAIIIGRHHDQGIGNAAIVERDYPFLYRLLCQNYNFQRCSVRGYGQKLHEMLAVFQRRDYLKRLYGLPKQVWSDIGGIKEEQQPVQPVPKATQERITADKTQESSTADKYWKQSRKKYIRLYEHGQMKSKLPLEEMMECLHGYKTIQYWRNQTNHANGRASVDINEMKRYIGKYLDQLEAAGGRR